MGKLEMLRKLKMVKENPYLPQAFKDKVERLVLEKVQGEKQTSLLDRQGGSAESHQDASPSLLATGAAPTEELRIVRARSSNFLKGSLRDLLLRWFPTKRSRKAAFLSRLGDYAHGRNSLPSSRVERLEKRKGKAAFKRRELRALERNICKIPVCAEAVSVEPLKRVAPGPDGLICPQVQMWTEETIGNWQEAKPRNRREKVERENPPVGGMVFSRKTIGKPTPWWELVNEARRKLQKIKDEFARLPAGEQKTRRMVLGLFKKSMDVSTVFQVLERVKFEGKGVLFINKTKETPETFGAMKFAQKVYQLARKNNHKLAFQQIVDAVNKIDRSKKQIAKRTTAVKRIRVVRRQQPSVKPFVYNPDDFAPLAVVDGGKLQKSLEDFGRRLEERREIANRQRAAKEGVKQKEAAEKREKEDRASFEMKQKLVGEPLLIKLQLQNEAEKKDETSIEVPAFLAQNAFSAHRTIVDTRDDQVVVETSPENGTVATYKYNVVNNRTIVPTFASKNPEIRSRALFTDGKLAVLTKTVTVLGEEFSVEKKILKTAAGQVSYYHLIKTDIDFFIGQMVLNSLGKACGTIGKKYGLNKYIIYTEDTPACKYGYIPKLQVSDEKKIVPQPRSINQKLLEQIENKKDVLIPSNVAEAIQKAGAYMQAAEFDERDSSWVVAYKTIDGSVKKYKASYLKDGDTEIVVVPGHCTRLQKAEFDVAPRDKRNHITNNVDIMGRKYRVERFQTENVDGKIINFHKISTRANYISGQLVINHYGNVCGMICQKTADDEYVILEPRQKPMRSAAFTATDVIIGGNGINCNWTYNTLSHVVRSNCVTGRLTEGVFEGNITCLCKGSNKWTHLDDRCPKDKKPKRHIVGRRFGGAKHGYNCFFNTPAEEMLWTKREDEIESKILLDMTCAVVMDSTNKYIKSNCSLKYHLTELEENFGEIDDRFQYYNIEKEGRLKWGIMPKDEQSELPYAEHIVSKFSRRNLHRHDRKCDLYYTSDGGRLGEKVTIAHFENGQKFDVSRSTMNFCCLEAYYFESDLSFVSGAPIFNERGEIVSVITYSIDNKYAILRPDCNVVRTSIPVRYRITEKDITWETMTAVGKTWVEGRYFSDIIVTPMHSLSSNVEMKDTHHHYVDFFSKIILNKSLGQKVHIGHPDSSNVRNINRNVKVLTFGYDGNQLHYQVAYTFQHCDNLISGTPLYNEEGQLISVVTASKGNKYVISNFYGPRGRVTCNRYQQVCLEPGIIYAGKNFKDKQELVNYIQGCRSISTTTTLYIVSVKDTDTTRLILEKGGLEIFHIYVDYPCVDTFHMGDDNGASKGAIRKIVDSIAGVRPSRPRTRRSSNSSDSAYTSRTTSEASGSQATSRGRGRKQIQLKAIVVKHEQDITLLRSQMDTIIHGLHDLAMGKDHGQRFRSVSQGRDNFRRATGMPISSDPRRERGRGMRRGTNNSGRTSEQAILSQQFVPTRGGASNRRGFRGARGRGAQRRARSQSTQRNVECQENPLNPVKIIKFGTMALINSLIWQSVEAHPVQFSLVDRLKGIEREHEIAKERLDKIGTYVNDIYRTDSEVYSMVSKYNQDLKYISSNITEFQNMTRGTFNETLTSIDVGIRKIKRELTGYIDKRQTLSEIIHEVSAKAFEIKEGLKTLNLGTKAILHKVEENYSISRRTLNLLTKRSEKSLYERLKQINESLHATEELIIKAAQAKYALPYDGPIARDTYDLLRIPGAEAVAIPTSTTSKIENRTEETSKVHKRNKRSTNPPRTDVNRWYLGNRDSEADCSTVQLPLNKISKLEKACTSLSTEKYLGPSNSSCAMGYTNIVYSGNHYIAEPYTGEFNMRCSLSCLSSQELLVLLAKQPLTWNCINPLLQLITKEEKFEWTDNKVDDYLDIYFDNIVVQLSKKTLVLKHQTYVSEDVCKGAKLMKLGETQSIVFKDGLFKCTLERSSLVRNKDDLIKWAIEKLRPIDIINTMIGTVVGTFLSRHFGLLIGGTAFTMLTYVSPVFSAESILSNCLQSQRFVTYVTPVGMDTGKYNYEVRAEVRKNHCINLGNMRVLRFKNLTVQYVHNFEYAVPSKVAVDCCIWDYNCPGQTNSICDTELDCCKTGTNDSNFCVHYCGAQKTAYETACWKSGAMNVRVESRLALPTKKEEYLFVYKAQMFALAREVLIEDRMGDIKKEIKVRQGYDTVDETGLMLHSMEVSDTPHYRYIVKYNGEWWCAHINVAEDICKSTNIALPWKVVDKVKCRNTFIWTDYGYKCQMPESQMLDTLGKQLVLCPSNMHISEDSQSVIASYDLDTVYVHMKTSVQVNTVLLTACEKVNIDSVDIEAGNSEFYKISIITIRGSSSGKCMIVVDLSPCYVISNPQLDVFNEFESKIEVLCGINYPADIVVRLKNGKLYKKDIGKPLIRDLNFFFEAKYSMVKGIVMTYNTTGAWNVFAFVGSPFAWLYNLLDFMAVLKWGMVIGFGYLITMSLLYGNVIMASLLFALASYMLGGMFGVQALEVDHQLNLVISNMYRIIYEVTPATVLTNRLTCALGIDNILDVIISIIGFRGCIRAFKDSVFMGMLLMMWTFALLDKNLILSLSRLWNRKNTTKRIELKKIRAISWYLSAIIPNKEWGSYNPLAITPYIFHRRRAGEHLLIYGDRINCNDRVKLSYDDISKVYRWADVKFKEDANSLNIVRHKGQCMTVIRRNAYTIIFITDHQIDETTEKPEAFNVEKSGKLVFMSYVEQESLQSLVLEFLAEKKEAKEERKDFLFDLHDFSGEEVSKVEAYVRCTIEGAFLSLYIYRENDKTFFKKSWKGLSGIILDNASYRIFVVQANKDEPHRLILEPSNILPEHAMRKQREVLHRSDFFEISKLIEALLDAIKKADKQFANMLYDNINVGIYVWEGKWCGVVHSRYVEMDELQDAEIVYFDNGITCVFSMLSLEETCDAYLAMNEKISLATDSTELTKRAWCYDSRTRAIEQEEHTFKVAIKRDERFFIVDFGKANLIATMLEGSFVEDKGRATLLEVVDMEKNALVECKEKGFWRATISEQSLAINRELLKQYNRVNFEDALSGIYWTYESFPSNATFFMLTNDNQNLSDPPKPMYDDKYELVHVEDVCKIEDQEVALDVSTSLEHLKIVISELARIFTESGRYLYLRVRTLDIDNMFNVYHAGNYYTRKMEAYRLPPIQEVEEIKYAKVELFGVTMLYGGGEIPFERAIRWLENNTDRNPVKEGKVVALRLVKWNPDQETAYVIHWTEEENMSEQKIIVHNSDIGVGNGEWAIRLIVAALQWDKNIHVKFEDVTACARFIKATEELPVWDITYDHRLSISVAYDPENLLDQMIEGIEREENTLSWPKNAESWRNMDKTTFTTVVEKGAMSKGTNILKVEELEGNLVPSFLQPGKFCGVLLSTGTGISRASVVGKSIVTNLHCVNKGNIVYTNMREYQHSENPTTYVWSNPKIDARTDLAVFGDFEFTEAIKNNLYAMVDLINGKTLYMLCKNIASHINGERGSYSTFVPVDVDFNRRTITLKKWEKKAGLSGSPIIDEKGNIVAVYGVSLSIKDGRDTVQYTTLAQPVVTKFDYANYFKNCAQEVARKDLPEDKQYFLLVAPTGTGKTITFTKSLAECLDYNGVIVLLEPTVAAAYNAFDAFRSWLTTEELDNKFELTIRVGQRNLRPNDTFGTGSKKISVYTAGKFAVDLKDILREASYILVDEAHSRNDETVCLSQLLLARRNVYGKKVGEKCRVIYMTATEIEFSKWGYTLGTVEKIPDTRYPIREERLLPCTGDKKVDGLVNLNLIGLAKDVNWQNNYKIPYEEISEGRVIVFVHKVKAAQKIAKQIKDQYPELNVLAYYAGCTVTLSTIPPQCIIVSTDVLGVSVTIPNCTCVIDLGLELKPSVSLTRNKNESSYDYRAKLVEKVITQQSADQRKGRTGRTCAGVYYSFPIDLESQVMWDVSVMTKVAFKAMLTVGKNYMDYESWCNQLQFDEARVMLLEFGWIHPEFNVPESSNIADRVKLASEADGDQLELYLRTVISKEWLRKQQSSKEDDLPFHHIAKASANFEWSKKYFETFSPINVVETQEEVKGRMELLRKFTTSEFNDTPDTEWNRLLDVRLLCYSAEQRNGFLRKVQKINRSLDRPTSTKLDLLNATESTVGASSEFSEEFDQESYVGVCGVTALLGTICVLGIAANFQIDKFGNRYITEMHTVDQSELPRIARHSPQFTKEHSELTGFIEIQISRIKRWVIQKWEFVKRLIQSILGKKKPKRKIESANALQFVDDFANWLQQIAPGVFTNTNMAASALGGVTAYCVDDFVKTFGSIPAAICIAGISMVTTVVAGIYPAASFVIGSCILYVMTRSDSSKSLIRNEYAGKCGKLLMGAGVSGVLIGGVYYNQLAKLLKRSNFQHIGLLTTAAVVEVPWYRRDIAPSKSVLAASKHLYFLCMGLVRKEISKGAFAVNLMSLGFNVGMGGFFHFAYVTIATLALFGAKYMVEQYQDKQILKAGEVKQSQAYTDISKRWQHIPEWFDEFVAVLGLMGNPASIFSILLRYLSIWMMEGDIDADRLRTVFKESAGVGLLVTIVQVIFDWICLTQDSLERESFSFLTSLKNLVFTKIPESIKKIVCDIKNWFANATTKYGREDKTSVSEELASKFNDGMSPSLVRFHTEVVRLAEEENVQISKKLLTDILNIECASGNAQYDDEIRNLIALYCKGTKANLSQQEKEAVYRLFFTELGEYEETFLANEKKSILRKIYDWLLYAVDWLKNLAMKIWQYATSFSKKTYLKIKNAIGAAANNAGLEFRRGLSGKEFEPEYDIEMMNTTDWNSYCTNTVSEATKGMKDLVRYMSERMLNGSELLMTLAAQSSRTDPVFGDNSFEKINYKNFGSGATLWASIDTVLPLFLFKQKEYGLIRVLSILGPVKIVEDHVEIDLYGSKYIATVKVSWTQNRVIMDIGLIDTKLYIVIESIGEEKTKANLLLHGPQAWAISKLMLTAESLLRGIIVGVPHFVEVTKDPVTHVAGTKYGIFGQLGAWWSHTGSKMQLIALAQAPFNFAFNILFSSITKKYNPLNLEVWIRVAQDKLRELPIVEREEIENRLDQLWIYIVSDKLDDFIDKLRNKELPAIKCKFENEWNLYEYDHVPQKYQKFTIDDDKVDMTREDEVVGECLIQMRNIRYNILPERMNQPFPRLKALPSAEEVEKQDGSILRWSLHTGVAVTRVSRETASITSVLGNCNCMVYYYIETGFIRVKQGVVGGEFCHLWRKNEKLLFPELKARADSDDEPEEELETEEQFYSPGPSRPISQSDNRGEENFKIFFSVGLGAGVSYFTSSYVVNMAGKCIGWCWTKWQERKKVKSIYKQMDYVYVDLSEFDRSFKAAGTGQQCLAHCLFLTNDTAIAVKKLKTWLQVIDDKKDYLCSRYDINKEALTEELTERQNYGLATIVALSAVSGIPFHIRAQFEQNNSLIIRVNVVTKQHPICLIHEGNHWDRIKSRKQWHQEIAFPTLDDQLKADAERRIGPQNLVFKEKERGNLWFSKVFLMFTTFLCFAKAESNATKQSESLEIFDVSVKYQRIETLEKCESIVDKNKDIFDEKRRLKKQIDKSVEAYKNAIEESSFTIDKRAKTIDRLSRLPPLKGNEGTISTKNSLTLGSTSRTSLGECSVSRDLEAFEMLQPMFDIITTGARNGVSMLRNMLSQLAITEDTSKKIACKVQDLSLGMIDFDIDVVEEPEPVYETEAVVSKDGKVSYVRNMNEISTKSISHINKYWHDTALTNSDRETLSKNAVVETVFYQAQHRMKGQLATLPKHIVERVKYADRIEPPSSARGCDATVYASKTATQWQLLYEEYSEIFLHAQVMFDVACGAGGFLQFMSWLGSTKGQPRRLVYYNTLMTEKHAKPLLDQIKSPNSLTDLVSCIAEEGNSDFRSREVFQKFLQAERPDFILFDCVEVSKKSSWHLKPRSEIGLNKIESETEYNNFITDYTTGSIRVNELVEKSFEGDITVAVERGVIIHCISSDWALERGLAKQLDRMWNLKIRKANVDPVNHNITVVSLETKNRKNDKPTLLSLFKQLRKYLREFEGKAHIPIYVPALGCGLDKLKFSHVAHMLQWFAQVYGLDITIVDINLSALVSQITTVDTHLSAMLKYCELLNNGGTMVARFIGYDRNLPGVVGKLSSKFKKISVWRSPSSPNDSLVWYLICTSYDKNYTRKNVLKLAEIIHPLRCELTNICEFTYTTAKFHKKFMNRSIKKYDWFEPKAGEVLIYKNQSVVDKSEPPAFVFNVTGEFGKNIQIHWKPEFRKRLLQITEYANRNRFDGKFKILPQGKTWKELVCLGSFIKGRVPYEKTRKWITNGLIADGLNTVFGITPANASYAFTQHTESFTEASYSQRLDRNPGLPDKRYALDLIKAMECLKTRYARSIEGKCRYLSPEETLYLMRNKGAVGKLDDGGTLEQWVSLHPDWYESIWRDRIVPWSEGKTTDCYFTMRNKKESKKRKDCDAETGRLNYQIGTVTDKELLLNGDMVPRQITFADAKTRLAQIVMLGDIASKHGNNKIYKGSITGTPPQYQGRILKALWKYHEGKIEDSVYDHAMDVLVSLKEGAKISRGRVCALIIDFSKFDFTQTLVDRVVENEFFASFCEDEVIAKAIVGAGREFGYSIVFNDHGDVVGKEGMRASGELPTSMGNTLQANAHLRVAIARSLGISIEELCETQGEMYFYVGGGFGPDLEAIRDISRMMYEANKELPILSEGMCRYKKFKKIELQRISIVCDGDDCIVLGNWDDIHRIKNSICEEIEFGKKILRSGDKAGVGLVTHFNKLSFCSHEYRFTVVSRVPLDTHYISEQDYATLSAYHTEDYKVYYLQTRNSCLSLGKMANTLKVITQKWDPHNSEAVNITRGKLASYLLLYPHLRVIREFALSALSVAGEGKLDFSGLWSFNDIPYDDSTLLNALFSLYGVKSLDQITYIEYKEEIKSLYDIKYNARLVGKNCPVRISDVRFNCYNWITSNNTRVDTRILQLNSQTANFFYKMNK